MENGLSKILMIDAVEAYLLGSIDTLVANGRMPARNIDAAKDRVEEVKQWLWAQPGEYFPVETNAKIAQDFICRAIKDEAAHYQMTH